MSKFCYAIFYLVKGCQFKSSLERGFVEGNASPYKYGAHGYPMSLGEQLHGSVPSEDVLCCGYELCPSQAEDHPVSLHPQRLESPVPAAGEGTPLSRHQLSRPLHSW